LKNNRYKLLVIDIDGTLINREGFISPENEEALASARGRGIVVALSTGRTVKSCRKIIEQLSLDGYHIFFDGALVSDCSNTEHVHIKPIDKSLVTEMVAYARTHNIDIELASATQYFAERETWSTDIKRCIFDIDTTLGDLSLPCERESIIRMDIVVTNSKQNEKAVDFMSYFEDRIMFSQAHSPQLPDVTFINVLSQGTSKGEALKALAVHTDVTLDEVVAVGDWVNDIALLTTAGLGIAMGNAHDDLKAVADHVTLDVEEHGLASAIIEFLL
jgi:Cof subfamily protein (haloacid dehalogenase superfamily)